MPFTDEQPFLDAIFARYHDDGPRFIYADFLDDAGDPERAELVRVQVALSRMTEDHPGHAELINKELELRLAHRSRWCDYLSDLVSAEQCDFRRGVLDAIVLDATEFLEKGEELFQRVPLRRLSLRNSESVMSNLVNSPLLANIHELDLCGNAIGNGGVNLLARSPFLKNLNSLDLGFNGIDDTGAANLARASTLPNLTSLSLSTNDLTSAGVTELAQSPFWGGLTTLDLSLNQIDAGGLQAVALSKSLARLHTLRLSDNRIGDAGIEVLAQSSLFERMLSRSSGLEFRKNEIGPAGAALLAGCAILTRCTSLDLNDNEIGDKGLAAISGSQNVKNLRVLKVGHNQITNKVIKVLFEGWPRNLGQLRFFDLSENRLNSDGCMRIDERAKEIGTVTVDVKRNNQASSGTETPISAADVVQSVLQGVSEIAEAAELKRRVSHPNLRGGERPNPNG